MNQLEDWFMLKPPNKIRRDARLIDLTGQRFERLVVLRYAGHSRWHVKCDCGAKRVVIGHNLKAGITKSCGCLNAERASERMAKYQVYRKAHTVSPEDLKLLRAARKYGLHRVRIKDD